MRELHGVRRPRKANQSAGATLMSEIARAQPSSLKSCERIGTIANGSMKSFEIYDRCLLNAKATRTHEHLPPRSKERRPDRSGAQISTADYHIKAEDRRCHDVKRPSTAPTSEDATLSKPKQTAATIHRWRDSAVVRGYREPELRGRLQEYQPKSTLPPLPRTGWRHRRMASPSAHSHRDSEAWASARLVPCVLGQ
ncbi:hypothetical protein HPB51_000145 [Rhipicephalus microplus]|uniref:Uncharacterized protein n=1 Tax=Rhipicephalus microplus TaxID=6941 RepID=A0A9J6D889_RHIMP|nr:hypothetical protein HPB51_000145 [Rhipicephalus microplus]